MHEFRTAISSGDIDSDDSYLEKYDLIITTSEKFDSLIRHKTPWLNKIKVVIIDEIHLLHDSTRGPTLDVIITKWLNAELVLDDWRPVKLHKGIYLDGEIEFYEE